MRTKVRLVTFGALGGVLLSALRAPLGLDLLTATAVEGTTAFGFRAAALFTLAIAIAGARLLRTSVPTLPLLMSIGLGYAVHGLWLEALAPLGSRLDFAIALIGIYVAMYFTARSDDSVESEPNEQPQPKSDPHPTKLLECLGLALGGAAVVIALETTAHPLRQLGLGLPADDTAFGVGFFAFLVLGAAAFGRFFPVRQYGQTVAILTCGVTALACSVGLNRLNELTTPGVLAGFVKQVGSLFVFDEGEPTIFRVDISHLGTWRVDLLLAGTCLILPGLIFGIALFATRDRRSLASLLVGAALGTMAYALLLSNAAEPLSFEALESSSHAAGMLAAACYSAGVGALLVAFGSGSPVARSIGVFGALLLGASPSFLSVKDPWIFSAWDQTPAVEPSLIIESSVGLLTVEPARGSDVLTLDRNRLTPAPVEEEADTRRIRQSLGLLGPLESPPRVLLVGQITPSRAQAFRRFGEIELERTAPWYNHMPAIEKQLFAGSSEVLSGERIALATARERVADGEYDLILIPPTVGRRLPSLPAQWDSAPSAMPRSSSWSVPDGTIAVTWLDTASDLANTDLGERVLISTLPFSEPFIGLVLGEPKGGEPTVAGSARGRAPSGLATLMLRGYQRQHQTRANVFRRLQEASRGSPSESWTSALSAHYGEQTEVNPVGSWDQGIFISDEMLQHLRTVGTDAGELSPSVRLFIEQIAKTLRTVRSPDLVLEYILPIAEAHSPWYELDFAVVQAYMEFDMAEEVEAGLPGLLSADVFDIGFLVTTAFWYRDRGDLEDAFESFRRAQSLQPGRYDVVRPGALIAHELKHQDAEQWLRNALELDPDDHEIRDLLELYAE